MANFYEDNDDLRFMFKHLDLAHISELTEEVRKPGICS
jgi:hypothetical protein